ncbi:beta-1,3-galactosyltransferase 2-like [Protopterus annectens]|uniref:beta-1,3-galactosyltransferase 2-like n=1 Tax=Protopterus annectens TaxID=7888 RepID=UPI001CFB34E0|nr:beta-1,3-galactosyltransferase 2-like [Protopterus annectens]XP_043919128.1 beta-1,3-galactosyltransferase 2-like [Protopterus annectens]XP_043919129.1 beta-1,3-galactosyltransferase 2-like [Protopterus annectens]
MKNIGNVSKFIMIIIGFFASTLLISFSVSLKASYKHITFMMSQNRSQSDNAKPTVSTVPKIYPLDFVYPYNYNFVINEPDKCKQNVPFLVLLITTHPTEIEQRHAIRRTWGNENWVPGVTIIRLFLTGLPSTFTKSVQDILEEESMTFHDIIQQDFMDVYVNLTIKTMMGLEWLKKFCPYASYALKTDSDMFINTELLVRTIDPKVPARENYFSGYLLQGHHPPRSKADKCYIPPELYERNDFPPYCIGGGYFFSIDMASKIYDIAQVIKPFNVEDAFVGVCLETLKIKITVTPNSLFGIFKVKYDKCKYAGLIYVHQVRANELIENWPDFLTANTTCPVLKPSN